MGRIMSERQTKTRQGRSKFLPLLKEIKDRLALGETQKMIFESYPDLEMSYPQFTRYVKKYCSDEIQQLTAKNEPQNIIEREQVTSEKHSEPVRKNVRNPADLRRLRQTPVDLEALQNSEGKDDESSNS